MWPNKGSTFIYNCLDQTRKIYAWSAETMIILYCLTLVIISVHNIQINNIQPEDGDQSGEIGVAQIISSDGT